MDLPEGVCNDLFKNTISYLHDISNGVPNDLGVLKSYYASKFRISQLQTKIWWQTSKNKFTCSRCCLKLDETKPSYRVRSGAKPSKFARKLVANAKQSKTCTRYQAKYLKRNKVFKRTALLVVKCNFCGTDNCYSFPKPIKRKVDINANQHQKPNKNRKKAKKKKDKFCGLRAEAVASAQQAHKTNENKTLNNQITKKRTIKAQNKKKNQLSKILNQNANLTKSKNCLTQFLMSLQ